MRNKSKIIVLGLIILLGFNFMMLPHFNTIISEILKKINQNFDLSTNNLDLLLVYTDPSGDVTGVADSTLDITYIYENRSMDLLNVTFVAPPDSGTGSEYIYELYIDSDNDNASAEYVVFHRNYTGGNESYIQNLTTYEYWNPSSLTWQSGWYNDTTLAYVVGNNLVFNFSSCSDCVGDNYYDVSAYCSIPGSVDGAIGSIYTSLSYFAGYSDKPIITNVSVSPLNALVNSNFTFYANVTDIDGIHTVSCMIKTYPTYVIIDEFELNDLGNSLYHNTWNSTGQENGIYTFEICANDSNGIERNMTNIDFFIIGDVKPSILRDDLAMDFIGIANISGDVYNSTESRGPWYYFTHYGTHTEEYFYPNNGMRAGSYYPESHETNNLTRIVTTSTGGFLPKGAFDPFWIPLTTAINETIYVYIGNGINQAFNVTGVEEFWYSQNNTEIWCWRLESELGDIAFYDNTTGILINASFYPNENDYYFYELQYTNEPIGAGPELSLESPEAYTYFFVPDVPIVLENYSSVQSAWYRNKTYFGGWSQNYSLSYSDGKWRNSSPIYWNDDVYQVEAFANDSMGRTTKVLTMFGIYTYGPAISFTTPSARIGPLTRITATNESVVDKMWYRHSTDSITWSNNYSMIYDRSSGLFINNSLNITTLGDNYIQVFANDSSGETGGRSTYFTIQEYPVNFSVVYNAKFLTNGMAPDMRADSEQNYYILAEASQDIYSINHHLVLFNITNEGWISYTNLTELSPQYWGHSRMIYTPELEIDENDVLHVSWTEMFFYIADGQSPSSFNIKYTNNSQGSFSNPEIIEPPSNLNLTMSESLDVSPSGTAYITFIALNYHPLEAPSQQITDLAIYTINNSLGTFSTPINITNPHDEFYLNPYTTTLDGDGRLHVVYAWNNTNFTLHYKNSDNWEVNETIQSASQGSVLTIAMTSSGSNITHITWLNNKTANYTIYYVNNTNGDFGTPKNVTKILTLPTISTSGPMNNELLNILSYNESGENQIIISWESNDPGNPEIYSIYNNGTLSSNWTSSLNVSSSSYNDHHPSTLVITNPWELLLTWAQDNGTYSNSFKNLMLDKVDFRIDYAAPTGSQSASTIYPNVYQIGQIWVNGTASDPIPSSGLYVEIVGSNTSRGIEDWSDNVGNETHWAFKNVQPIESGVYQVVVNITDYQGYNHTILCNISGQTIDLTLIHVDPLGDPINGYLAAVDVANIYENKSMDLLNVTFAGPANIGSFDRLVYELYIDADNDNSTAEYLVRFDNYTYLNQFEASIQCLIPPTEDYYWDSSTQSWVDWFVNDTSVAYSQGDFFIFNFSTCPDAIGDNYYGILTQSSNPYVYDGAIGDQIFGLAFFAGLTSKPTITNASIFPRFASVNSNFTFNVEVIDPNGTDTVICTIKEYPSNTVIDQIQLFDDGSHNDGAPNDDVFGYTWNSTGQNDGTFTIDIYANDTLGNFRNVSNVNYFVIGDIGMSILQEGLSLDFIGEANYSSTHYDFGEPNGPWYYYTHFSEQTEKDFYPNNGKSPLTPYSFESHVTDNVTRIIKEALNALYLPVGAFDPFWIHLNTEINQTIYLYTGAGNIAFNVTSIEKIDWNNTQVFCWRLFNSTTGDVAYYEITTGILINASFDLPAVSDYQKFQLQYTNINLARGPIISLESPLDQSYYNSGIDLIVKNNSNVESMWYRNSTNGITWSNNYSLTYIDGKWRNESVIWNDGITYIEIYANDSQERMSKLTDSFRIDSKGPEIYTMFYPDEFNQTRIGPLTRITVMNESIVDKMWFRNSTDSYIWSNNYSINYDTDLGLFINNNLNITSLGNNFIQIFANESSGAIAMRIINFTIQDYPVNLTSNSDLYYSLSGSGSDIRVDSKNNYYILGTASYQDTGGSSINSLVLFNISDGWIRRTNITELNSTYWGTHVSHITPEMEIDSNDVIHISWSETIHYQADGLGAPGGFNLKYINNSGGTFNPPAEIPMAQSEGDRPYMISLDVSPNGIAYITFVSLKYEPPIVSDVAIYTTNNSLGDFSTPINITTNHDEFFINHFKTVLDVDGRLHIVYIWNDINVTLIYKNSDDWSKSEVICSDGNNLIPSIASSGSNVTHITWLNVDDGNYSIFYVNNTNGDFGTPENISKVELQIWSIPSATGSVSEMIYLQSYNQSGENQIFISWQAQQGDYFEIYMTYNNASLSPNWYDILNVSEDENNNDRWPSFLIIPNPGEVMVVWERIDPSGSYSDIIIDKIDYRIDYAEPSGIQSASTLYPSVGQSDTIWVNGTTFDPPPSSGIYIVEVLSANTSGGKGDWSSNLGTGTNWAFCNVTSILHGIYEVEIRITDNQGYQYSFLCNISVDLTSPSITLIEPSTNTVTGTVWFNGTVSGTGSLLTLYCNDSRFEILDNPNGTLSGDFSFYNNSVLPDGPLAINLTVVDDAGYKFTNITSIYIDNSFPTISVTQPTTNTVTGTVWFNGTVSGTGSPLTLYCNDSRFEVHDNPNGTLSGDFSFYNNSVLPDGPLAINLTVVDDAGYKFTNITSIYIDNSFPTISVTQPTTNTVTGTVWFNGTVSGTGSPLTLYCNDSRFEVHDNPNGTLSGIFSFYNETVLPEGPLAINLTVVDDAGFKFTNITSIYIDNTIPDILVTLPSLKVITGHYWIEGWAYGTGSPLTLYLNDSRFNVFLSPNGTLSEFFSFYNNSVLPDGPLAINLTVVDDAGFKFTNITSVFIDNSIPSLIITQPSSKVITGQVMLAGTVSGTGSPLTLYCNDSRFNVVSNPNNSLSDTYILINNTILPNGPLVINLTIIDSAGFTYTNITSIYIDRATPTLIVDRPNTIGIAGDVIRLRGYVDGTGSPLTLYCNDSRFQIIISNPNNTLGDDYNMINSSSIPDGLLVINLTVVDMAGFKYTNITSVYIDNSIPTLIVTQPAIKTITGTVWLNGTVDGTSSPLTLYCNDSRFLIITNPNGTLSGVYSFRNNTNLPNGPLAINLTVVDSSKFKYTNITSIYVDNSNPIIYVSEPSVSVVTGILWLNGTVDGTGSPLTLYCNDSKFDVAINPNGSIYNTYSLFNNSIIPDGLITINLTVMDMAGFKYTNITSIYVDNSIPNIGITSITNGSVKFGNIVWINGTVNATGSIISSLTINDTDNFEVVLNPIGQETGTFAIRNKSPLSDGKFALKITVTDLANLQNDTNLYFYIDNLVNLNPIIQLTNPSINGSVLVVNSSNYLVLEGNVQGVSNNTELVWINQSGWILEINPSGTPGGPFRFRNASTFPDGLYWINITVNNTDGNSTSLLLSFYIDTIAPPTPGNLQGTVSGNNVTLTWDNVTDLTNFSFVIYRNGQQIATTTALSYTDVGLSPGTYTYLVYVVDDAGNICAVAASKTVSISSGEAPPQTIDWMLIIIIIVIVGASIAAGIGIFIAVKRKSRRTEPEKVPKLKKEEIKKDKVTPKKVERDEKAGKSEEISVLREYDYVGGEIRFKVAVRNESPGTISKLNVILSSTEQYLVDEKMKTIEVLTPGESRGVDFNLTPLTCGKSRIFATLSYADSTGEPKSLTVSPKDIWIKCPLVTPKETSISQVMVWKKELLNGSSMVEYSNVPDTQAFKIALDQVSALDLFEVTRNEHDKTATFSGVAKVTDTKMIIEVSIHSQKIHLNVWTGDMKQATGFLAYIKNLIKMSLETAKNIEMKAEAISQMIFDSIEICNRIIALLDLCKKRENVGDILLIIGEIITRLTRSFPDIPFLENAGEWKQSISTNLRPGDNIPRNYSIRLQSDSLIWFQKILELAKSNSELFETTFRDHHSQILQIKSKIVELAERYLWEEKRYSMSIVKYMMIINKESGVTMYQRSFFETKLDPDLISGFLTAIQSFGLELSTEESSMKKLVYRDFQIELEDGDYVRAALIMEGEVTQFLMRSLLKFVNRFERTFAEHLENWDGRLQQFEDADKIVDEEFEIERPPK